MTFKNETFVTASTLINKVKHVSNVTIDWTGITDEDMQALAQRSIIIKKQNADRLNEVIPPTSYTIKAVDFRIGARAPKQPVDIRDLLAKLSPEEAVKLLEEVMGKAR
jgi:hypothetical protein